MASASNFSSDDIPLPPFEHAAVGYPALSAFMSTDKSSLIFKRFASLSARDPLVQQAELLHLEEKLHHCAKLDAVMDKDFDASATALLETPDNGDGNGQLQLILEIRVKLVFSQLT